MKKTTVFSSALIAGVLFASSAAMAAPHEQNNRLDVNMPKLEMRIDAGVQSGKLTPTEERQLRTELRQLGSAVRSAMRDHKVSKRERNSLESKETTLSQHITKLANNKAVVKQHGDHRQAPPKPDNGYKAPFEQGKDHNAPPKPDNGYKAPFEQGKSSNDHQQYQQMPHAQR